MNNPKRFKILFFVLLLGISFGLFSIVSASWQEPSGDPPSSNIAPPLYKKTEPQEGPLNIKGVSGKIEAEEICLCDASTCNASECKSNWDAVGGFWNENAGNIYYNEGNVGIGTALPQKLLHVEVAGGNTLQYVAQLTNNNAVDTGGSAVGMLFGVETQGYAKGALVYERTSSYARGNFYFLQNSGATQSNPTLADAVMTIKNNGFVGIGTTNPADKLHIAGGGLHLDDDKYISWGGAAIYGDNTWPYNIKFLLNSTERMRVTADGNIGLGTATPNRLLHVYKDSGDNAEIDLQSVAGAGEQWSIYHDRTSEDVRFWNNDAPGDKNVLTLGNDGKIGIGTTEPRNLLHLSVTGGNTLQYVEQLTNKDSTDTGGSAVGTLFSVENQSYGKGALVYERKKSYARGNFYFLQNDDANTTEPSLADAVMTIKNSGSVGINETDPISKLGIGQNSFSMYSIGNIDDGGTARSVFVYGNYAYMANDTDGFRIYDISNPTSPQSLGHSVYSGETAYQVFIQGNHAYLATGVTGFMVYDISNPASPTRIYQETAYGLARGIYVQGNYAYLANGSQGVYIYDISNPASPQKISVLSDGTNEFISRVYVQGKYAFLGARANGFLIGDVSDPVNPHIVADRELVTANDVYAKDDYLYLANGTGGIRIYNVSDPANPQSISQTTDGTNAEGIYLQGNIAYLACSDSGFRVYDISNPASPSRIWSMDNGGQAYGLFPQGAYGYLANGDNGLRTYEISAGIKVVDNKDAAAIYAENKNAYAGYFKGNLMVREGKLELVDGTQGAGKILTSDDNGIASWQQPGSSSGNITGVLNVTNEGTVSNYYHTTSGGYITSNYHSKFNQGSDKGFLLLQDESAETLGNTSEDIRFTMGVYNDFYGSGSHSDELWLQGGGRLVQNVGTWDSEMNTLVGTPNGAKTGGNAYEWRVNNSSAMVMAQNGSLGVGAASPTTKIDVVGGLRLQQSGGGNSAASLIELGNRYSGWAYGINFNAYYDGAWKYRSADYAASMSFDNTGSLVFSTMPQGTAGGALTYSPKLTILNGGNVGIGNPNPTTKLEVTGTVKATSFEGDGSHLTGIGGGLPSGTIGQTLYYNGSWLAGSNIYNNGTNVGIGTTAPAGKLQVSGGKGIIDSTSNTWGQLQIGNTSNAETSLTFLPGVTAYGTSPTATYKWNLGAGINGIGTDKFGFGRDGSTYMALNTSGNVGIGTTSLAEKLNVVTSGRTLLTLQGDMNGNWVGTALKDTAGTEKWFMGANANKFLLRRNATTNDFAISSTGNVGIGTDSPGAKLHVKDSGKKGLKVYPEDDYVALAFDDSGTGTYYNLRLGWAETLLAGDLLIGEGGDIGIGVDEPESKLSMTGGGITIDGALQKGMWQSRVPVNNTFSSLEQVNDEGASTNNTTATAITIGKDGLPVIAYLYHRKVAGSDAVKVIKCRTATCDSFSNLTNQIGPITFYADSTISMAIGSDGFPVISYCDDSAGFGTLHVAKCYDSMCSIVNTIPVFVLGDGHTTGWQSSITIGTDGFPIIAYGDNSVKDLRVAKCNDLECADVTITSVDSTAANVGDYPSITIGSDGLPVISYYDATNYDLKVLKCGTASCNSGNTITAVETSGATGYYTSITIGNDGFPIISYKGASGDLKIAKCANHACSSGTTFTNIDSVGDVGYYTSIAIGSDGFPVISYYDGTNYDLKIAKCGSSTCSAGYKIDSQDNVGKHTSIAIGSDGLPVISYYDRTNQNLKVVKCGSDSCVPYWTRR